MKNLFLALLSGIFKTPTLEKERAQSQTLIETRLSDAESRLEKQFSSYRDQIEWRTERQLDELARKKWKPLLYIAGTVAGVSFAFNIMALFKGKEFLEGQVKAYVDSRLIEPNLEQRVKSVVSENAGRLVTEGLSPLQNRIDYSEKLLLEIKRDALQKQSDLDEKQIELAKAQQSIEEQQAILNLATAAKGGELAAYIQLQYLAKQTNLVAKSARAAETDVHLHFENFVSRNSNYDVKDTLSGIVQQLSIDEWVLQLHDSRPDARMIAAYQLGNLKRDNTVGELCEALKNDTNLYSIAHITHSVSAIVGKKFDVLGKDEVINWWETQPVDGRYSSPFMPILACRDGKVNQRNAHEILNSLKPVIEAVPDALWARSLCALADLIQGDPPSLGRAEIRLAEIERISPSFRWLFIARANLAASRGNEAAWVDSANKSLQIWPSSEEAIRKSAFPYTQWLNNTNILWPRLTH